MLITVIFAASPVVSTYTNEPLGIRSEVADLGDGRFSVRLIDTDADEALPTVLFFADRLEADAHAELIAGDGAAARRVYRHLAADGRVVFVTIPEN